MMSNKGERGGVYLRLFLEKEGTLIYTHIYIYICMYMYIYTYIHIYMYPLPVSAARYIDMYFTQKCISHRHVFYIDMYFT